MGPGLKLASMIDDGAVRLSILGCLTLLRFIVSGQIRGDGFNYLSVRNQQKLELLQSKQCPEKFEFVAADASTSTSRAFGVFY